MLTRNQRRLKRRYDEQVARERNGAPIPPEIAARMTRPNDETLYQCFVTERMDDGRKYLRPIGPRSNDRAMPDAVLQGVMVWLAQGKLREWSDPHVVALVETEGSGLLVA